MQTGQGLPPHTTKIGQACYKCFIAEAGANLQKCSTCLRVAYCSVDCQKADWAQHKAICKAFDALEKIPSSIVGCPNTIHLDVNKTNFYKTHLKRALTTLLRSTLWAGSQNAWLAAAPIGTLRHEAVRNNSPRCLLIPCSDCRMTFYCCITHQEAVQSLHTSIVPPECEPNAKSIRKIRVDVWHADFVAGGGGPAGPFLWAPERTKGSWGSVKELDWMGEFAADFQGHFRFPGTTPVEPWIRGVSVALSMPMSILWALEMLNGADKGWTRRSTLTIHMMGVYEPEVMSGQVFEEILHRLPEVKTLDLVMCGPQLSQISLFLNSGQVVEMETCPECRRKHRKRFHYHYSETYHDFMRGHGTTLPRPDLAVAFNSGASEVDTSSWQETMQYLAQNHIPSLFTAYDQEEAQGEVELLTQAGAQLVFGPGKNSWGSIKMTPEPMSISGFCAANRGSRAFW